MRMMWKGAISFGLVSIPVGVYTATEEKDVGFHQLHDEDLGRIKYERVCSVDGEPVPYDHIVRGYEYEKGHYVVVTDEEFDSIPVESNRVIDIQQFVDADEIDPIYFQKSYYLVPDKTGIKPYVLLREALRDDRRVAVAKVSFRNKEHLATIRLQDEVLVMETMFWPDEIREPAFAELEQDIKIRPQEREMASQLIDNLTDDWKPEEFQDEYRAALLELIEKKAAGEEVELAPPPREAKVVDLMEALKASVQASQKRGRAGARGGNGAGPEEDEEEQKPARKSRAKRATAGR